MTLGERPRCPDCGAQLRRGRDPCQRSKPRIVLPEGFYDQPALEAALAGLEFGPVFYAVRGARQCSQQTLAEFLGWEQRRISALETGTRSLVNLREVVHVANKLGIPASKLGFTHGVTVGRGTGTRRKGSWVQRRDFVNHAAALSIGTGLTGLDIDRLVALMPEAEPTGTRHVGAADVETIEQATAAYYRQDFAQGSGLVRDGAVAQLRATLPLLDAQVSPEVRPRLLLATAELALMTGYMSADVTQHDAARRLWLIGLDLARHAKDPRSGDLTVYLLYDMAQQAVSLGRPDEALSLVHLGHAAAAAGAHPVSAATTGCLLSSQAQAHAARGDRAGCERALGQAVELISIIDPASTPPWVAHVGEAVISGFRGRAHYRLALADGEPHTANRTVPLLRQAVEGLGPDHAMTRAFWLPDLAGAHALAGDVDTAVAVGHQAIDAITALHSPHAYNRLRVLHTALQPLRTSPGVAELRERLVATAA